MSEHGPGHTLYRESYQDGVLLRYTPEWCKKCRIADAYLAMTTSVDRRTRWLAFAMKAMRKREQYILADNFLQSFDIHDYM